MKLLVVVPYFPYANHPFSGAFNERTVQMLKNCCECVEVLVPRPYTPTLLSKCSPRWRAYANIPVFELRKDIPIYRPGYFSFPKIGEGIIREISCYMSSRTVARKRHNQIGFDAIVSFGLFGAGSLAWRLGNDLGIPACGWGTGGDLAQPPGTIRERVVLKALGSLDLVFYQSYELMNRAATILNIKPQQMNPQKHIVLARGIGEPPPLKRDQVRKHFRSQWELTDEHIVVMNIGRAVREKGIFELFEVAEKTRLLNDRLHFVWIGAQEGFDDGPEIRHYLKKNVGLGARFHFLPGCPPDEVWQYLCAADIFVFPSHHTEGMPNALLEAMRMGVPAVAFGIPCVSEIDTGLGALFSVPPWDIDRFGQAILQLANDSGQRKHVGQRGREVVVSRFLMKENMKKALAHIESFLPPPRGILPANRFVVNN